MMKKVFVKLSMSLMSAFAVLAFSPLACCAPYDDIDLASEPDSKVYFEEGDSIDDISLIKECDKENVHRCYLNDSSTIDGFCDTDVNNKDPRIRILIYTLLTFDAERYHRILSLNKVFSSKDRLNMGWSSMITSDYKHSQLQSLSVRFENRRELKRIIFRFDPKALLCKPMSCGYRRSVTSVINDCNRLLEDCGIRSKFDVSYETYCDINKVIFDNFVNFDSAIKFKSRTYENMEELMKDYNFQVLRFNGDVGATRLFANNSLVNIGLQGPISSIGERAFSSCKFLKNVVLPKFVMKIGECAFENCESLESINIPEYVTEIGKDAFKGCKNLKYIEHKGKIYNDIESFIKAFNIKVLKLNGTIGKRQFSNRKDLENIEIQGSVRRIYDNAFEQCPNLKTVKVPDSVEEIGNNVFFNCFNLRSIEYKGEIYYSVKEFERAVNTRVLQVGESIVDSQFIGRQDLKCIEIPSSVKNIGFNAFKDCMNLTSVVIPSSVETIDLRSFESCRNLNHIEYKGRVYKSVGKFLNEFTGKINF